MCILCVLCAEGVSESDETKRHAASLSTLAEISHSTTVLLRRAPKKRASFQGTSEKRQKIRPRGGGLVAAAPEVRVREAQRVVEAHDGVQFLREGGEGLMRRD